MLHNASERIRERAGIADYNPHDLRRTADTTMAEFGAAFHHRMRVESHGSYRHEHLRPRDFLGHANITTTSRYLTSTPLRLEKALANMEPGVIRTPFAQTLDPTASSEQKSTLEDVEKPLIQ